MVSHDRPSSDIVIIGGGIMGASLAWQLARRGAGRVTLLERSVIAAGASGKTGALLRRHYSNRPEAILAQRGWQTFAAWPEVVGGDPVHTPAGLIVTVETAPGHEANVDRLHRNVAIQNEVGISSRVVTREELRELQPQATWDDVTHAAYEPDSGYVDAIAATQGMARAAQAAGAVIHERTPALGIEIASDRVRGVRTAHGVIATETIVVAAGPWTPGLLAGTGVNVPVETLRVQVAIVQRPLAVASHMALLDTVAGVFARPWGPGRTMIGLGGGDRHDPVDPDSHEPRNDPGYGHLAIAALARRILAMNDATYLHGHAGLFDLTPDAHPIIGPAGPAGLFLMAGFSGAGFKKGPAVAEAMADLLLEAGEGPAWVDLRPFRLERFASDAWRTPWSADEYTFRSDFGHGL
ncbi:MAG: NAD(P)/FAD-dependent oxidoreductase [Thermomicrobiales bacterium]